MSQPPLSRAIQRLEQRLGVALFERDRRAVRLTDAVRVLLEEARNVCDAAAAATHKARRTADTADQLVLVSKAGASHELLRTLLDTHAAGPDALPSRCCCARSANNAGCSVRVAPTPRSCTTRTT